MPILKRLSLAIFVPLAFLLQEGLGQSPRNRSNFLLDYRISEELSNGVQIGNLAIDGQLSVTDSYRYSLLPSNYREYFTVDANTGILETSTKPFDRDSLCAGRNECVVTIDVYVAQGLGAFELIKVQITVDDINDNNPRFQPSHVTLHVPETAHAGSAFPVAPASDRDFGVFGIAGYRLEGNGSSVFRLGTPEVDRGQLRLVLQEKLDRESEERLFLQITAFDGGTPSRSGVLLVDVVVQDANDNSPVFTQSVYSIDVEEGKTIEGPLIRVSATDPDEGDNGRIVYDFSPATQTSIGSKFLLDNSTGEVYLRASLDFEERSSYELLVTARDMGVGSVPGTATVLLRVLDLNDNPPRIYVWGDAVNQPRQQDSTSSTNEVFVLESSLQDVFVAQIYATDPDSGANGQVSCYSVSEDFHLSRGSDALSGLFRLTAKIPLDRETKSQHTATIQCNDHGDLPLRAVLTVNIIVLDVNDNAPQFTSPGYLWEMSENSRVGTSLFRVQALDRDSGENGRVSYEVQGKGSGAISVDRDTGVVSTGVVPVDRETVEILQFVVLATDHGSPNLTSTQRIILKIIDVNDEEPRFSQNEYSFYFSENLPVGSTVGSVVAIDLDQPPFNAFVYSIVPNPRFDAATDGSRRDNVGQSGVNTNTAWPSFGDGGATFRMDNATGLITAIASLDREKRSEHRFFVVATDVHPPYLSSTATVTVHVTDDNDNAPVVRVFVPDQSVSVPVELPVGSSVMRVDATDADEAENSRLRFSILQGNDDGFFDVDPASGEVRLARSPSPASWNDTYSMIILVSDSGHTPLTTNASVYLRFSQDGVGSAMVSLDPGHQNQTILLVILCVTCCLVAILIVAIFYTVRHRLTERANEAYRISYKKSKKAMIFDSSPSTSQSSSGPDISFTPLIGPCQIQTDLRNEYLGPEQNTFSTLVESKSLSQSPCRRNFTNDLQTDRFAESGVSTAAEQQQPRQHRPGSAGQRFYSPSPATGAFRTASDASTQPAIRPADLDLRLPKSPRPISSPAIPPTAVNTYLTSQRHIPVPVRLFELPVESAPFSNREDRITHPNRSPEKSQRAEKDQRVAPPGESMVNRKQSRTYADDTLTTVVPSWV